MRDGADAADSLREVEPVMIEQDFLETAEHRARAASVDNLLCSADGSIGISLTHRKTGVIRQPNAGEG